MRFPGIGFGLALAAIGATGTASETDVLPQCQIAEDLVATFDQATVANSDAASASMDERCGGVSLPGIFLHPTGSLDDAVLTYESIAIPRESPFLLFRIGMRDHIPWGAETNTPNGVRFLIAVNGNIVFQEENTESGWKARALSLADWAGQGITLELRTNAIDQRPNYDWAAFGNPLIVSFNPATDNHPLDRNAVGVALAHIDCSEPAAVTVTMGEQVERAALPQGPHYLPVHFTQVDKVRFNVETGSAKLLAVMAAPFLPQLHFMEVALSSPLVTAGSHFAVLRTVKNTGLGAYLGDEELSIAIRSASIFADHPPIEAEPISIGKLAPGETKTYVWKDITVSEPGDYIITGDESLAFHVFPSPPEIPTARPDGPISETNPDSALCASIANPWGRLTFVREPRGDAYALAEAWNGAAWQRVGSLYPLAHVVVLDAAGIRRVYPARIDQCAADRDRLVANGYIEEHDGRRWPVRLSFHAHQDKLPITIEAELTAGRDADLLAFYGPGVLAGDKAYGVEKDFTIFPGLEYLRGDEESSSERDLAYPLSDRRVPAVYKIATPLMAVQAQDALFALLWDANSEWSAGARHPAARFLAPPFESGYQHIHMALFAPSIGDYVPENHYEAPGERPYRVKASRQLRLESCVVMDHKARYGPESIVDGPHTGGLVLQAMQHWFDVYGLPEPSPQPRDWETERALCRDAYFNAVWSENPPGYRHCAGWNPGLYVGHAVPQLMQIREGAAPEVQAEIERNTNLVIERALKEEGPHYLWTNAACHIAMAELPFYYGYLPESLADFKRAGFSQMEARTNGLWIWRPSSERHAGLGVAGDHTLGQASYPSMLALRAARMTGDLELTAQALEAMKQMERYEVPRGAQMWECPLYQPDILAAGRAVRAYCEAYRLTGDRAHLAHARYWAWTGLPFLYTWQLDGYPTMRYNVISVMGSTFYTHSWIGLPVVWCGLVYAYGLLDLAEFDDTFPWDQLAQGIVNSTMWQQYTEGPSKGCYPDSWHMVDNAPRPADISPENILMNEYRLRGPSPEIRSVRLQSVTGATVMLNSAADIEGVEGPVEKGGLRFTLTSPAGFSTFSLLAPVIEPTAVAGAGERVENSEALQTVATGWLYDLELSAVVLKTDGVAACEITWQNEGPQS